MIDASLLKLLVSCWVWIITVQGISASPLHNMATSTTSTSSTTTSTSSATTTTTIKEIIKKLNVLWNDFSNDNEQQQDASSQRPFVIASYAQSIDGFMAPWTYQYTNSNDVTITNTEDNNAYSKEDTNNQRRTTAMYPLSSASSLVMTHAIRSQVDAILIGSGTVLIDNPRLNNRLWSINDDVSNENVESFSSSSNNVKNYQQPRPVVLDTNLRLLFVSDNDMRMTNPIICCSAEAAERYVSEKHQYKSSQLDILPCDVTMDGKLVLFDVLTKLYRVYGIKKIMIEGGAKVLSSFFQNSFVDSVCITIAPKLLHDGIAASTATGASDVVDLNYFDPSIFVLENDMIVVSSWRASNA